MHAAELTFEYRSKTVAALIAEAVAVELGEIDGDRATATLQRQDSTLLIEIDADDLVALRAGLNTWETLVTVAERATAAGRGEGED